MPSLLNVNNYHYRRGGAEVVYLEHGEMFAKQGWNVDWFSMRHPENLPEVDDRNFADLIDLEHTRGGIAKLRAAAAIVYNIDAQAKIGKLVDANRPDIAHLHNIYHHLSPSVLVALKKRGIPTVLTAHDLKLACPNYKMLTGGSVCERCRGGRVWNVALHACIKRSPALSGLIAFESAVHKSMRLYAHNIDRIIAPSRFYREKLVSWGWEESKVRYIPNFTTVSFSLTPVPISKELLYFGRLSEEKGVGTLIYASALSGIPVLIAGTGPEQERLHRLAAALSAPVTFMGYCSRPKLGSLFERVRAVVLPSEWYENAPMSILESFSAGRPVIGARMGGIPELIEEGVSGWTFEAADVNALASLMTQVANESTQRLEMMGKEGNAFVQKELSANLYFKRMETLYAEVMVER